MIVSRRLLKKSTTAADTSCTCLTLHHEQDLSSGKDFVVRAGMFAARTSAQASAMSERGTERAKGRRKKGEAHGASKSELGSDGESSSSSSEEDIFSRTSLDLSKNPMPDVKGLTRTLSQFRQLQKLDVSGMGSSESNPKGLSSLEWLGEAVLKSKGLDGSSFGQRLTWLKMTNNPALGDEGGRNVWSGMERLVKLTVLNASSCALNIAPPASALLQMPSLGALILAHNNITSLSHLPYLPKLNTLVLSDNKISKLPKELPANLPSLKKLSITHNDLHWVDDESPLPDFSLCSHLREMRLSANGRLKRLPLHMSTWGRGEGASKLGTGLDTLDVADCGFQQWEDVQAVLQMGGSSDAVYKRSRGLGNITLKGNPLTKLPGYRGKLLEVHPTLRTIDGERVEGQGSRGEEEPSTITEGGATPKSERKIEKRKATTPASESRHDEKRKTKIDQGEKPKDKRDNTAKLRKRGKRGGTGVKEKEAVEQQPASKAKEMKARPVKAREGKDRPVKGERKFGVETHTKVDRAVKRAGSPPPPSSSAKGAEKEQRVKSTAESKKPVKRKAWDTQEDVPVPRKTQRTQPPTSQEKQGREPSSVAAIVQLKKEPASKKGAAKPVIWGALGAVQDGLGEGSGWS